MPIAPLGFAYQSLRRSISFAGAAKTVVLAPWRYGILSNEIRIAALQ
jgi:hypothetical protein